MVLDTLSYTIFPTIYLLVAGKLPIVDLTIYLLSGKLPIVDLTIYLLGDWQLPAYS